MQKLRFRLFHPKKMILCPRRNATQSQVYVPTSYLTNSHSVILGYNFRNVLFISLSYQISIHKFQNQHVFNEKHCYVYISGYIKIKFLNTYLMKNIFMHGYIKYSKKKKKELQQFNSTKQKQTNELPEGKTFF